MAENTKIECGQPIASKSRDMWREMNPNWRGGRSVASNGYILIRVSPDHHLADVRGYAYEHRIVAERKMGRRLLPDEQVHHINEDKQDNRPENLEVAPSLAHHHVMHRRSGKRLRFPDEPNPMVECACGCGAPFSRFDGNGRERLYLSGHNHHPKPTFDAIVRVLADSRSPVSTNVIRQAIKRSKYATATCLNRMKAQGVVVNPAKGFCALPTDGMSLLDGVEHNGMPELRQ